MKKIMFGAIALVAVGAGPALAADLPAAPVYTKAPAVVPEPAYNWTGFYVGATAGAAWSHSGVSLNPVNGVNPDYRPQDIPGVIALGSQNIDTTNAIFGGRAGYNQQFGAWVVGLEGDISSFHFNKTTVASGNPFSFGGFTDGSMVLTTNVSSDWLATVRPRIGYAVNRTLFYVTGGVAIGKVSFSNTDLEFAFNGDGFGNEASAATQTRVGWTAGAGIDYALTNNWILSAEYLHVDLGSIPASGLVTSGGTATATLNFSTKLTSDIVRAGISYKFGGPVVAKY